MPHRLRRPRLLRGAALRVIVISVRGLGYEDAAAE